MDPKPDSRSRWLGAWTAILGGVLLTAAAVSAGFTVVLVSRGMNKGGDFGALGVIAALAVGAVGVPVMVVCAMMGRWFLRAGRAQLAAGRRLESNGSTGLSSLFVAGAALLPLAWPGLLAADVAGAALFVIFGSHALATLLLGRPPPPAGR